MKAPELPFDVVWPGLDLIKHSLNNMIMIPSFSLWNKEFINTVLGLISTMNKQHQYLKNVW
jgi:hypothetical protein